jgi:hypothetical protein
MLSLALTLLLSTPDAQAAGKCDALVKKAEAAKGTDLATAFTNLAGCDHKLAEDSYMKLLSNAADSDALVAYSLAAIKLDIWNPVWGELSKIPDYSARDEVASRVGAACATEPKVTAFLQGAYFGLRDIEFSQWDDAFAACENTSLSDWLTTQVSAPPEKLYDEKFNALMGIYVNKQRAAALPVLSKAAVKAAKAGPFDAILQQMDAAVAPSLGETLSEEDKAALEKALIEVAKGVDPEKAKLVADRLGGGRRLQGQEDRGGPPRRGQRARQALERHHRRRAGDPRRRQAQAHQVHRRREGLAGLGDPHPHRWRQEHGGLAQLPLQAAHREGLRGRARRREGRQAQLSAGALSR